MHAEPLAVEIAGGRLLLRAAEPGISLAVRGSTALFKTDARDPDIQADVGREDLAGGPAPGRLLFSSGGLWDLFEDGGGRRIYRFTSPALGPAPYKEARFDRDLARGEIAIHSGYPAYAPPDEPLYPLEYPLDELLFMHWLSHGRGCELHGCGLVDGEAGYLFVGHSGAGKTTMARLWGEAAQPVVLSDDRIVVRRHAGEAWMYGTPWHGEAQLAAARKARLRAIFILRQAASVGFRELGPVEAVPALLSMSFVPHHSKEALAFVLEFLRGLAGAIPCVELAFPRHARVVDEVRARFG